MARLDLLRGAREHYADAVYYDFTYRTRTEDIAYYRRIVQQHGGPVLELGGGSGRVSIALAKAGYDVLVLDASTAMLKQGRARAREELDRRTGHGTVVFQHADMRSFALGKKFPTIVAPFNTLLHLYEPDDFAACFRNVVQHLTPDGVFVFDVRMPSLRELTRDPDRVYRARGFRHPTLGHRIEYSEQFEYDPVKQVQHVTIRFEPGPGAPPGAKPVETLLSQRQIFPNELRALLALGGLRLTARHGDFTGRALHSDDVVQIITAKRAAATAKSVRRGSDVSHGM
jgi:SAM-dependent methyltransferase